MQAYANQMACLSNTINRFGPGSLPDCMMTPEMANKSPPCLERRKTAAMQPFISTTQSFQTSGDPAPLDPAWSSMANRQEPIPRQSTGSSSNANVKPKAEDQQPKPRKHWSSVQRRRVPHHVVERRYRDNLNGQIEALRTCIPSLAVDECSIMSDVEDGPLPTKLPSKASVIATAQTYIKELEEQQVRLLSDAGALRGQVAGLQKLVRCEDCSVVQYVNSLQFGRAVLAA